MGTILQCPAPTTDGAQVTLDTSGFDKKLAVTDNLVQELATAFDEHTHAYSEITSNTHTHGLSTLSDYLAPNDNLTDLGSGAKRWKDIYAGNAVIQTSDRNYKEDIQDIENSWAFLSALRPCEFKFKGGSRVHTGFIAQDVKENLPKDYAIYCEQNGVCGLRYEEAIAPIVWCVQDLADSMMNNNRDIGDLQAEIVNLRNYVDCYRDVESDDSAATSNRLDMVQKDVKRLEESLHKTIADLEQKLYAVASRKAEEPVKQTNWLGWAAVGISIISVLLRFV